MRNIVKTIEPNSLAQHRRSAHADYENYPDKDGLRESLVTEQRGLCCYCMFRIDADPHAMKIEHWQSQTRFANHQLDYSNLLGACLGGKGKPSKLQHCDTRKGKVSLSKNPASAAHDVERIIKYDSDGTIRSTDPVFDVEINEVLNLNDAPWLKANRAAVLTGFLEARPKRGGWNRRLLEKWLREWNGDSEDGELKPYCQVVVYWLRKRLRRA